MKIGISGGTGLIGTALVRALVARGDNVVVFSRRENPPKDFPQKSVEFVSHSIPNPSDFQDLTAMVNLAGESLAGVRWTDSAKEKFRASRVAHTRSIVDSIRTAVSQSESKLQVFLSASAIGYYGSYEETGSSFTEDSKPGEDFLAKLSLDWEESAEAVEALGIRLAIPRIGIVLDPSGGALSKLVPVFRSFIGGPIGSGTQGMSWIHIDDVVKGMIHILDQDKLHGAFNFTSPNPVTNQDFSKTLGKVLNRPSIFWTPEFAVQALFGEGAGVVTKGQMVRPKRLVETGYTFQFPNLEEALVNLLKK